MKIGMITQWYDPEEGSAGIPASIARSLERLGHTVTVLTGFPNYPTGKIYDGYRMCVHAHEIRDSISVHRVALYPSHDGRAARRIANFASFAGSAAMAAARCLRDCEVILVYSTPATVGAAGIVLHKLLGLPFVLFIQDMWPDTLLAAGMLPARFERPAWRATEVFCNAVYRNASKIAVIAPSMKETLVARRVPSSKVDIIFNWADETVFRPVGEGDDAAAEKHSFELMYAGNLGDVQGLEVAVQAMSHLPVDHNVRLRLVGAGVAKRRLGDLVADMGLSGVVTFEGRKSPSRMPAIMSSADAQLICLRDLPLFRGTVPSKFQAILACGLQVIVSAPGDIADLAEQSGAGYAVPPEDPIALAETIGRLAKMSPEERRESRASGRAFYDSNLSEAVGAQRLAQLLEESRKTR